LVGTRTYFNAAKFYNLLPFNRIQLEIEKSFAKIRTTLEKID